MKRLFVIFNILLCLALSVSGQKFSTFTIDGMHFYADLSEGERVFEAMLLSGHETEGDVLIPDTINLDDTTYVVTWIDTHAFKSNDKITKICIPGTVKCISEGAFDYCRNLRTVIIPGDNTEAIYAFCYCNLDTVVVANLNNAGLLWTTVKNLYVQSGDTAVLGSDLCDIDRCYLGDINHVISVGPPFGNFYARPMSSDSNYSIKGLIVNAAEPPTVEQRRYCSPEDMKLCWTVLFVPDGSEEKYRQAEFWKDFYAIKPISEMDRYDEYVAEAFADFSEWAKAGIDAPREDAQPYSVEGDALLFTGDAQVEVCDPSGRLLYRGTYVSGQSLKLPTGVNIISVNGHRQKIAVK